MNDSAVVGLIIPADTDAPVSSATVADNQPDVWAVVEDKRKTKTKKNESDATTSSTAAAGGRGSAPTSTTSTPATPATVATSSATTTSTTAATTVVVQDVPPSEPVDFVKSMVPVDAKKLGAVIGAKGGRCLFCF